jgi:hypothetical protein
LTVGRPELTNGGSRAGLNNELKQAIQYAATPAGPAGMDDERERKREGFCSGRFTWNTRLR